MGSPAFAVPSLLAACAKYDVVVAISQPDKPAGRGKLMQSPAVTIAAAQLGIATWQPASVRTPEFLAQLQSYQADIALVVAYGKILPATVLKAFQLGCINVHGSLLPGYRGAAPIQWAVINAEPHTGVSIMQLDPGMDTGPVFSRVSMALIDGESAGQLADRMAIVGADALMEVLPRIVAGQLSAVAQADGATIARMLTKQDGAIDFAQPARLVAGRICGVDPWPGAQAWLHRRPVLVSEINERTRGGPPEGAMAVKLFGAVSTRACAQATLPGQLVSISSSGADVACASGEIVRISDIQIPGKKRIAISALAAGRGIAVGDVLSIRESLL
jgi:methionyl-tRNA formyltransferase